MQPELTRGVVYAEAGGPVAVEPILVGPPAAGEVLVRVEASGVCHTDVHVVESGGWAMRFPILLGHEGAGVVEAVGDEVTSVAPGDRVVIAWRAPCGECDACRRLVSFQLSNQAFGVTSAETNAVPSYLKVILRQRRQGAIGRDRVALP